MCRDFGGCRRYPGRRLVLDISGRTLITHDNNDLEDWSLEMICVDGGQGLPVALRIVYHGIPVLRCRTCKIRNILNKAR